MKTAHAVALLFLVVVAVVAIAVGFASRDIPAPDTADLVLDHLDVPADQNAYTYFVSATNVFHWAATNSTIVNAWLDGESVDETRLAEIIATNRQAIERIQQGLKCRRCITPELLSFDAEIPYLTPWKRMGQVMALKARNDRLARRYADATDSCLSVLKFGDLVQKDAACIINHLVGIAILGLSLTQAEALAQDKAMPPDQMKRLAASLAELGPFGQGCTRSIKAEYWVAANTLDKFRDGKIGLDDVYPVDSALLNRRRPPRYFFQPNKTKLLIAACDRDILANVPRCYADMKWNDPAHDLELDGHGLGLITRPNGIGKVLFGMLVPATDSLLERKCRAECAVAATRLVIACNAYRAEKGTWPDDLQALVPVYLAAVPVDPFDGKAFRYSPSKRIVYSVGKDLKDSGGSSRSSNTVLADTPSARRWKAADIVFKLDAETVTSTTSSVQRATGDAR